MKITRHHLRRIIKEEVSENVARALGEELEDSINSWIASRIKVEFLPEIGGQHVIRGIDPGMFNDVVEEIQDSGGRVVRQAPSKLTGWDIYVML